MRTPIIVAMTKEEILHNLRFMSLRKDVQLLKECCDEILNEKCQWRLEHCTFREDDYFVTSCEEKRIFCRRRN